MSDSLLLFSIGPVQDFIAAGRKTKDLFGGSFLLSRLSSMAIRAVVDYQIHGKPLGLQSVLFPYLGNDDFDKDHDSALPNRFLARVPASEACNIGKAAEGRLRDYLARLVPFTPGMTSRIGVDTTKWIQQLTNFLECNWVTLPLPHNEADYGETYRKAEALLGQRKMLRDFRTFREEGSRCSLIPNLTAVVKPDAPEQLSAVALLKRHFPASEGMGDRFPSTSSVAAAGFIHAVMGQPELHDAARTFTKEVSTLFEVCAHRNPGVAENYKSRALPRNWTAASANGLNDFAEIDGDWFFVESYSPNYLRKACEFEGGVSSWIHPVECRTASESLATLIREAAKFKINPPSKYYGIFYFDGDNMGKWLSGEYGNQINAETHRTMSGDLNCFAMGLRMIIEQDYLGKVVYSGGDDLLAFVALQDCLSVVRGAREYYKLGAAKGRNGDAPTASVGLAIAHHMMVLREVLANARRAEWFAKKILEKDSLGIALLKRSGDRSFTGGKWRLGETSDLVAVVEKFSKLVKSGAVSTGFIHDIADELPALEGLPDALRWEFVRLLHRRAANTPQAEKDVESFELVAGSFIDSLSGFKDNGGRQINPTEQALQLLAVGQFIAKGGNQ